MICQACGFEAPTKYVAFYQNIGAIVMRFHKSVRGQLCKACVHRFFWRFTLTNLFLGWWGAISLWTTAAFMLNNVGRYTLCLAMPGVPADAAKPELTEEAVRSLSPHTESIVTRLDQGEKLEEVARDVAPLAGVTPGQVLLHVYALAQQQPGG